MEKIKTKEKTAVDKLLEEAHAILNSSGDLNSNREKLSSILDRIVSWKDDGDRDEQYFHRFERMMSSMSMLDFSKRLPINSTNKSLQNLISHSLNMVNEELEEKVFSKALLDEIMKELDLKEKILIVTNYDGIVKVVYSGIQGFPTKGYEGQKLDAFFEDMEKIKHIQLFEPKESIETILKAGYSGTVKVKIRSTPYKLSEGIAYIIQIP